MGLPQPISGGVGLLNPANVNAAIANGLRNYSDGLVALAGGGQAGSTLLALGVNFVKTVATGSDSLMLPPAVPGSVLLVKNGGANAAQVFANTQSSLPSGVEDTINGTAGATGVSVGSGATAMLMCTAYGAWFGPVALT